MTAPTVSDDLLRCLVQVIGRAVIPVDSARAVVDTGKNRIRAFNLCDGSRTQSEIARKAKIDQGNLSRSIQRWIENGIAFWIGEGQDARLLHIYSIPPKPGSSTRRRSRTRSGRRK